MKFAEDIHTFSLKMWTLSWRQRALSDKFLKMTFYADWTIWSVQQLLSFNILCNQTRTKSLFHLSLRGNADSPQSRQSVSHKAIRDVDLYLWSSDKERWAFQEGHAGRWREHGILAQTNPCHVPLSIRTSCQDVVTLLDEMNNLPPCERTNSAVLPPISS